MALLLGPINDQTLPGCQQTYKYSRIFPKKQKLKPKLKSHLAESGVSEKAAIFIQKLLIVNPANRLKATEALNDSYFVDQPLPDGNIIPLIPHEVGIV